METFEVIIVIIVTFLFWVGLYLTMSKTGENRIIGITMFIVSLVVVGSIMSSFNKNNPSNEDSVYYKNCSEAPHSIRKGEPGYRSALDRDNDGVACER